MTWTLISSIATCCGDARDPVAAPQRPFGIARPGLVKDILEPPGRDDLPLAVDDDGMGDGPDREAASEFAPGVRPLGGCRVDAGGEIELQGVDHARDLDRLAPGGWTPTTIRPSFVRSL